ncbi:hypothetical protein EB118_14395 [bacterium]|nr:hypothetical protein [bacterium]NDD83177.1 hypothetical protein [bacterium]NDG31246.1 hypothetical protein [bacterium]
MTTSTNKQSKQSFINKGVNYSQTEKIKVDYVKRALEMYNTHLMCTRNECWNTCGYIISNNNKKYYIYVLNKGQLEQRGDPFDIMYFFPDPSSAEFYKQNKYSLKDLSDFYIETDTFCEGHCLLLEGYMYQDIDGKQHMLLTDFLVKDNNVVDFDFNLRYTLLIDMVITKGLLDATLNDHTRIGIHPIIPATNDCLVKVFKQNFIYSDEIVCTETVDNFTKVRHIEKFSDLPEVKYIVKEKTPDTYSVYNKTTHEKQGILYVKGILESEWLRSQFNDSIQKVELDCVFNVTFRKWQPIL